MAWFSLRRWSLAVSCALLLTLVARAHAGTAEAADEASSLEIVTNVWTAPEECPAATAVKVDLQQLAEHSELFVGKCVRTSGLWNGVALYTDVAAYYRLGPAIGSLPRRWQNSRIGVYGREDVIKGARRTDVGFATITGVISRCESLTSSAVMVFGYCHYSGGIYISAASITAEPRKFHRQVGEEARRQFGNLMPLNERGSDRSAVDALATRWMRDIKRGDVTDFALLHGLTREDLSPGDDELFSEVFKSPVSSFAGFRGQTKVTAPVFFQVIRPKPVRRADPDEIRDNSTEVVACFCRQARCEGRWPITRFDATNASERPYACLMVRRNYPTKGAKDIVETPLDYRRISE